MFELSLIMHHQIVKPTIVKLKSGHSRRKTDTHYNKEGEIY